jgi:DNA-binding PadR family transcriptional regulator
MSARTQAVPSLMLQRAGEWHYGLTLAKATGQAAGTRYPIMARLAGSGLLEAVREQDAPEGRPRRHLCRLTPDGLASAHARRAHQLSPRSGVLRLVTGGQV